MFRPATVIPEFLRYLKNINDQNQLDLIFYMNIKGGWEKWLHLEFANFLRKKYRNSDSEMTIFNDDRKLVDILITERTRGALTAIELKCQTSVQDYAKVAREYAKDIVKMNLVKEKYTYKYVIAFVNMTEEEKGVFDTHPNKVYSQRVDNGLLQTEELFTTFNRVCSEVIKYTFFVNREDVFTVKFDNVSDVFPYCRGIAVVCKYEGVTME